MPTITVMDGTLSFTSETPDVVFKANYSFEGVDATSEGNQLKLAGRTTCHVSVYASKDGFMDSEPAIADIELSIGKAGDVNLDGKVTITDAVGVVDIILNAKE